MRRPSDQELLDMYHAPSITQRPLDPEELHVLVGEILALRTKVGQVRVLLGAGWLSANTVSAQRVVETLQGIVRSDPRWFMDAESVAAEDAALAELVQLRRMRELAEAWVRDIGLCHFCHYGRSEGEEVQIQHDGDCPLREHHAPHESVDELDKLRAQLEAVRVVLGGMPVRGELPDWEAALRDISAILDDAKEETDGAV